MGSSLHVTHTPLSQAKALYAAALAQLGPRAVARDSLANNHPRDGRIMMSWLNVWGSQKDSWHQFGPRFGGDGERAVLIANFGLLHEMLNRRLNDTASFFSHFVSGCRGEAVTFRSHLNLPLPNHVGRQIRRQPASQRRRTGVRNTTFYSQVPPALCHRK